jgi:alpha-tubulin suppressor-like RCC1 family protein
VAVTGLKRVKSIATGLKTACAIADPVADAGGGGTLYCWGDNTYGQLGTGSIGPAMSSPVRVTGVPSGASPMRVAVGIYTACAVLSDGTAVCWGDNTDGQLGNGTLTSSATPTPVQRLTGATDISVGDYATCAVANGGVQCWGDNTQGQLGNATYQPSLFPVTVLDAFATPLTGVSQVSIGFFAACAVAAGEVQCWGEGPVGNDRSPSFSLAGATPVVGVGLGVTAVTVGSWSACAIVSGKVKCWGLNSAGQLGNGGAVDVFSPVAIPGFP